MALSRSSRYAVLAVLAAAVSVSGCVTHSGYGSRYYSNSYHGYRDAGPRYPHKAHNSRYGPGNQERPSGGQQVRPKPEPGDKPPVGHIRPRPERPSGGHVRPGRPEKPSGIHAGARPERPSINRPSGGGGSSGKHTSGRPGGNRNGRIRS